MMKTTNTKKLQPRARVEPTNDSNPGYATIKSLVDRTGLESIKALFPGFAGGGYDGILREAGGMDLLHFDILKGGECGDQPELTHVYVRPCYEGGGGDRDELLITIEHKWFQVPDHFEIRVSPIDCYWEKEHGKYAFSIPTTRKQGRRLDSRRIAARALSMILA